MLLHLRLFHQFQLFKALLPTPSVTASPCHLPLGGRLFFGPETFPLRQKAPSQRELAPKVTEGVTQNTPASVPFSSVPAFQGSVVPPVSAGLHTLQRRQIVFEEKVVEQE